MQQRSTDEDDIMAAAQRRVTRKRIVDAALQVAEREGWENLRLHQVAAACGAGLDDIRAHFAEKDDLIDAWFDRADAAMLRLHDRGDLDGRSPRERIRSLILTWLDTLAPHHRVTREMISHKLEFGHVHVQFPALLRISRTVQWIREAALLDAPLPRRALEETAMTALFVKVFLCWLYDRPPEFTRTHRWLDRGLDVLETAGRLVPGGRFGGDAVPSGSGDSESPGSPQGHEPG
ncbi:MAG: TetR/AcrR family transcriptional regulator [Halofilum sp. (in: g-proteobacteria)]|nr:TetR/AcrR family transcriptional regulator [Halofilum sp. (in: g-proteobacteria)]